MAPDVEAESDLPASLEELLDQHEPETIAAIRDYCDQLLEAYDIEEDLDERTYG
ncbi:MULTISPECIES: hypothetical protein [Halobellus]|uniref:hypothetical protein n=1 Tax=Halobellus TaxID=1073986 RepID=UPI00210E62FC|nr:MULTISPECIES: hypothetical protein [Halobellus]MDQ2053043.1 hypothetical protein [Halobellus sp. H-GB7]